MCCPVRHGALCRRVHRKYVARAPKAKYPRRRRRQKHLANPFIITPLITGTIGYFAISIGFAARSVVMVPWPVPAIINAYIGTAGDIGAVITQIICIIVSVLIYLPFVKAANKSALNEAEAIN